MGIIDKSTYTLKCPNCEIVETLAILDKGSNWGGSIGKVEALSDIFIQNGKEEDLLSPLLNLQNAKYANNPHLLLHLTEPISPTAINTFFSRVFKSVLNEKTDY